MKIKVVTNIREFIFDTNNMKLQNRSGMGVNLFGLIKKKLRKDEELIDVNYCE